VPRPVFGGYVGPLAALVDATMNVQQQPPSPAIMVVDADSDRTTILAHLVGVLVRDHEVITASTVDAVLTHVATRRVPLVISSDQLLGVNSLQLSAAIKVRSPTRAC
jgi:DNA-binding NtrC family response regulator